MTKQNRTPEQLREEILALVREYHQAQYGARKEFAPGDRIAYAGRVFDEQEMLNLVDSSLEFWLTTGRYADRFESKLAEFLGVRHCSLVNSGSSANLLAFMALTSPKLGDKRIRRGDEVITVACGFPTTVAPLIQYGAVPVFVDVTLPTYNIDCDRLVEALSPKTRAVMVAHTLGNPFDLRAVKEFCDRRGLWLVEDNCDALGSKYLLDGQWKHTGTVGDIGTSSFYPPHHMTMGEGGAVYTDDPTLHRIVVSMRDWGRDCWCPSGHDNTCGCRFTQQFGELPLGYDHKYVYSHLGYNLKITDMQAAVGLRQLERLNAFVEARRRNFTRLHAALQKLDGDVLTLPQATAHSIPSWFGFLITLRPDVNRTALLEHLNARKIGTRLLFAGNMLRQPCFEGVASRQIGELQGTDTILRNTFWVGCFPGLGDTHIDYIGKAITEYFKG